MTDQSKEGFRPPLYCPRGLTDCQSLAQVISVGHASFICCGENDGKAAPVKQDRWTFCHKSGGGIDATMYIDRRDMAHFAAVFGWALAVVATVEGEAP